MFDRFTKSTTFRLALLYAFLFSTSVLGLLAFIYWSTAAYMTEQVDVTIEAEVQGLAERYNQGGISGLSTLLAQRVARRQPTTSSIYLLVDENFRPVVGNLDRWPQASIDENSWMNFKLGSSESGTARVHQARGRVFPIEGRFYLLVGRDIQELVQIKKTIIRALIWGLAITGLLALVGGGMISRSIMRKIETINRTSQRIMTGSLSQRIPTRGGSDEFDVLGQNLNRMLERIEELMEDVRRVTDNIAHDLRTPLARLRNHLEDLKYRCRSNPDLVTPVEQALQEADTLLTTFNALLRIARIESARQRTAFAPVSLPVLLRDVAEFYEPLVEEKQQRLTLQIDSDSAMEGDRDLLFQCVANLVDNAIKYTPDGGRITVALGERDGGAEIIVADTGPGVPPALREKVFQRFYRVEESRTTQGNGLGLSLVAAVCELHGVSIRLEDNYPGLRVVLSVDSRPAVVRDPAPEVAADPTLSLPGLEGKTA